MPRKVVGEPMVEPLYEPERGVVRKRCKFLGLASEVFPVIDAQGVADQAVRASEQASRHWALVFDGNGSVQA